MEFSYSKIFIEKRTKWENGDLPEETILEYIEKCKESTGGDTYSFVISGKTPSEIMVKKLRFIRTNVPTCQIDFYNVPGVECIVVRFDNNSNIAFFVTTDEFYELES